MGITKNIVSGVSNDWRHENDNRRNSTKGIRIPASAAGAAFIAQSFPSHALVDGSIKMAVKNQAITVTFSVVDVSTGLGKTGDAGNLTIKLIQDGVAATPTNACVEVDATNAPGTYKIALTAAEMNYDTVRVAGKSSTSNVVVIPVDIRTLPISFHQGNINANMRLIASTGNEGNTFNLYNMAQDYGADGKVSAAVAIGNGHIPITASIRSDDRYMVAAQFTKAGAAVEPSVAPTCAADCIVVSDDYPTGHTFNFGALSLQYNSTTKSYYAFGVLASAVIGNRAGLLICKFHTDDATVDAPDVTCAVAVNMERYNPELVEPVLADINAKTKLLGTGTVTVQSPMVTATKFEIIRGDSYTNDTPFPNRPLWIRLTEVTFDLAALAAAPHGVRIHLKNGATEAVITPYSVVQDAEFSNAYTIAFGMTDEETRAMTAGTWEYELKAYYRHATSPDNYRVVTLAKSTFTVLEPVNDGAAGP